MILFSMTTLRLPSHDSPPPLQARSLLREAGVPFMEDAESGDGSGGKKGKGGE